MNLDFHNLLKAKAMNSGVPVQLLLPSTYDKSKRRSDRIRRLQDEAARAWNTYIALYYKAGGSPGGSPATPPTSPSATRALASTTPSTEKNSSRAQPGCSTSAATGSFYAAVRRRGPRMTGRFTCPARTSAHNSAELEGFREALDANGVDSADSESCASDHGLYRDD